MFSMESVPNGGRKCIIIILEHVLSIRILFCVWFCHPKKPHNCALQNLAPQLAICALEGFAQVNSDGRIKYMYTNDTIRLD